MWHFLATYGGTLLVAAVVAAVIVWAVWRLRKDKKQGKSTCGANCAHCPSAGMCHKQGKA